MKTPAPMQSASALIDARIEELRDWRGTMLAQVRAVILAAGPRIVEEWKWRGTPVWSQGGILCTGETYQSVVQADLRPGRFLARPGSSLQLQQIECHASQVA